MAYIQDKQHFIRYLERSLADNPGVVSKEQLLPLAFYVANIYDKGLTDRFCWEVRQQGPILLREAHVMDWLSKNNFQSYIVQTYFKHEPTKEFLSIAEDLHGQAGLYSFWSKTNTPLYVGMSIDLGPRMLSSFKRFDTYNRAVFLRYSVTKSPADAALLEVYFINTLKPPYNKSAKFNVDLTVNVEPIPDWSEPMLCSNVIDDKE